MKKILIALITLVMFSFTPLQAMASVRTSDTMETITYLTNKLEMKLDNEGIIENDDEDLLLLTKELSKLGVTSDSYYTSEDSHDGTMTTFGYGQWHDLGSGWKARVDKPTHGGDSKPHIHVEKGSIKGAENVDGTRSHGKTLSTSGVPHNIQKKARGLADYKKAQKDLTNMKKAKQQINSKNLNLRKTTDIIVAIGIFVSVVGFVLFATSALGPWSALLLAI